MHPERGFCPSPSPCPGPAQRTPASDFSSPSSGRRFMVLVGGRAASSVSSGGASAGPLGPVCSWRPSCGAAWRRGSALAPRPSGARRVPFSVLSATPSASSGPCRLSAGASVRLSSSAPSVRCFVLQGRTSGHPCWWRPRLAAAQAPRQPPEPALCPAASPWMGRLRFLAVGSSLPRPPRTVSPAAQEGSQPSWPPSLPCAASRLPRH